MGERTIRTTLERLERKRLLTLAVPGRPGATQQARRAALYLLPTEEALAQYLYRGTRSMGPPAQVYGTPTNERRGTPAQVYGTPTNHNNPTEETAVVTVTIRATDPATLAATLDALRRDPAVAVQAEPERPAPPRLSLVPAERAGDVRPARRRRA